MAAITGRSRAARRWFDASLAIAQAQGARFEEAQTLQAIGRVGLELGWIDATTKLQESEALLTELRPVRASSHPSAEMSPPPTLALADRFSTLLEVGRGKLTPADVDRLYELKDRSKSGPTVPPHGLFMVMVDHDSAYRVE